MYIDHYNDEVTKIYTTKELQDMILTEEDKNDFLNTGSLYMSLTVNMFKFCGYKDDDVEILNICRNNPAYYVEYTWTKEQRSEFEHIWTDIFAKCLDIDKYQAFHELSMWNAMGTAFNLSEYSDEYYGEYLKLIADLEYPDSDEDECSENNLHQINIETT